MKRTVDVLVATLALVLTAPVLLVAVVLVRLRLGRPVLFTQRRAGRGGAPFTIVKLRTMTDDVDEHGRLRPDAERLTPLGSWLRDTSLDELPELWNVLRGDMSLVGPRPLPVRYLSRYRPQEGRRHEVRPGLTGWAQVNGRNALGWEERLALDVWYVDHRSWHLDLRIIGRTVGLVLGRRGISAEGSATMEELPPLTERQAASAS
jgi:lipopolysaccharide/colanic/teichoic acid biosynthesis glycosyltransferase